MHSCIFLQFHSCNICEDLFTKGSFFQEDVTLLMPRYIYTVHVRLLFCFFVVVFGLYCCCISTRCRLTRFCQLPRKFHYVFSPLSFGPVDTRSPIYLLQEREHKEVLSFKSAIRSPKGQEYRFEPHIYSQIQRAQRRIIFLATKRILPNKKTRATKVKKSFLSEQCYFMAPYMCA